MRQNLKSGNVHLGRSVDPGKDKDKNNDKVKDKGRDKMFTWAGVWIHRLGLKRQWSSSCFSSRSLRRKSSYSTARWFRSKIYQVKIETRFTGFKANLLLVGQVTRYLVSLRNVFSSSAVRWSRLLFESR